MNHRGDGHRRRRSAWHERVRQRQEAAFLQLGHIGDEAFKKAKEKAMNVSSARKLYRFTELEYFHPL